jgi:hypothetical protein
MYEKVKTYAIAAVAVAVLVIVIMRVMPGDDSSSAVVADGGTDAPAGAVTPADISLDNPAAQAQSDAVKLPKTNIVFEESMHDFGEIVDGDQVKHTFKFTNGGTNPLVISNAQAGCGCTVPSWPRDPIGPGESGEIVVAYNSTNKVGFKTVSVTVTANTDPPDTELKIQANVLANEEGEAAGDAAGK